MKILFKQNNNCLSLDKYGISNCYLKHISSTEGRNYATKTMHHHTGFEIHIIQSGHNIYASDDNIYDTKEGYYFLIPPKTYHKRLPDDGLSVKYALSFNMATQHTLNGCYMGKVPARFFENMIFVEKETKNNKYISYRLIENSVLESIILLLRNAGLAEEAAIDAHTDENHILTAAKLYITDNIESPLTAKEIASYCHISTRQLSRIFSEYESTSPMQYIASRRAERIQYYLVETDLILNEISERMHFRNEYYFNTFSKKHLGMPPGAYRRMYTDN